MEEAPLEAVPSFAPLPKKKINKRFIYLIFAIFVLILLFFGFKNFSSNKKGTIERKATVITPTAISTQTLTPTSENSPTPSTTNTPTPKPTVNPFDKTSGLDRSKLSITVENGSGEAGVASKGTEYLKSLGYNVSSSGNADNFNYSNVSIQIKSSKSEFLSLLKKDLGFNYTVGSASADLSNSFSSDTLVIIGK